MSVSFQILSAVFCAAIVTKCAILLVEMITGSPFKKDLDRSPYVTIHRPEGIEIRRLSGYKISREWKEFR